MKPNHRAFGVFKGIEEKDGVKVFSFIASTSTPDRHGDIVVQEWELDNFRANPVILQNHDYYAPVVGMATKMEVVDGQLVIAVLFDTGEHNPDGRRLAAQVEAGFVRAASVGFRPKLVTPRASLPETDTRRADRGYLLAQNELYELSIVSVPANAGALAAKSGPMDAIVEAVTARVRAEMAAAAAAAVPPVDPTQWVGWRAPK